MRNHGAPPTSITEPCSRCPVERVVERGPAGRSAPRWSAPACVEPGPAGGADDRRVEPDDSAHGHRRHSRDRLAGHRPARRRPYRARRRRARPRRSRARMPASRLPRAGGSRGGCGDVGQRRLGRAPQVGAPVKASSCTSRGRPPRPVPGAAETPASRIVASKPLCGRARPPAPAKWTIGGDDRSRSGAPSPSSTSARWVGRRGSCSACREVGRRPCRAGPRAAACPPLPTSRSNAQGRRPPAESSCAATRSGDSPLRPSSRAALRVLGRAVGRAPRRRRRDQRRRIERPRPRAARRAPASALRRAASLLPGRRRRRALAERRAAPSTAAAARASASAEGLAGARAGRRSRARPAMGAARPPRRGAQIAPSSDDPRARAQERVAAGRAVAARQSASSAPGDERTRAAAASPERRHEERATRGARRSA